MLRAALLTDARGLLPAVERLATGGPDDVESQRIGTSGPVAPFAPGDRSHLAQLWTEPDAATRAKLLTAFGTQELEGSDIESHPERRAWLEAEFARTVAALPEGGSEAVRAFVGQLREFGRARREEQARRWGSPVAEPGPTSAAARFEARARETLSLPSPEGR